LSVPHGKNSHDSSIEHKFDLCVEFEPGGEDAMSVVDAAESRLARTGQANGPVVPVVRQAGSGSTRPPGRHRAAEAPRALAMVACEHRRAPLPLSWVLALGVAVCLAVVGLGLLANAGAGGGHIPHRTDVVRVQPGESLLDLAERVAPASDPAAVVERIRVLNGLTDSAVRPGQPLTVPAER
jgi:hypothetical protein